MTIVQTREHQDDKIYFGAWVKLEDAEGDEVEYRIVGPDESKVEDNAISMDSPIGKALMGRSVGDEISVKRPKGIGLFEILGVRYQ